MILLWERATALAVALRRHDPLIACERTVVIDLVTFAERGDGLQCCFETHQWFTCLSEPASRADSSESGASASLRQSGAFGAIGRDNR